MLVCFYKKGKKIARKDVEAYMRQLANSKNVSVRFARKVGKEAQSFTGVKEFCRLSSFAECKYV